MKALKITPAWILYPIGLIPAVYYFWAAINNQLGADPLAVLENALGEWALKILILVLAISPIMRFSRISLVKFRRPLGLVAFTYVLLHLIVYLWLDRQFDWWAIWTDILKRPYITIGSAAFLMMIPLAFTSNNKSVKRLGAAAWQKMHMLVYPAAIGGAIHYVLLEKVWEPEAIAYLVIITTLVAMRWLWKGKHKNRTDRRTSTT